MIGARVMPVLTRARRVIWWRRLWMLRVFTDRWRKAALGMLVAAMGAARVGGQQPAESPTSTIEGTVYDSLLARAPLKGATVYVVGTTLVATSDNRGRFRIDGVPDGEHSLTFAHPTLDSAGVQPPVVSVRVTPAAKGRVAIATPSAASILMANCPGKRSEQTGLLLGVVRDVDSGAPLPRARVVSRWFELTLGPGGPRYETLEAAAITDQTGVYRLCGVPAISPCSCERTRRPTYRAASRFTSPGRRLHF